jgi:uncharacterized protein (TIGR00369 family)
MDNPGGLRLQFDIDEKNQTLRTRFVPPEVCQGWDGIVHGGILSTLLDEAVAKLAYELGYDAVTAKLTVTFRRPAKVNQPLEVFGKLERITSRAIEGRSRIEDSDGNLVAEGEARLIRVSRVKA